MALTRAAEAGKLSAAEATRQKELAKELKAVGKKVADAEAKVATADEELASLNAQVDAIGGVQLRVLRMRVETLGAQLSGVEVREAGGTRVVARAAIAAR